ncbi:MAG: YbbR-like domain-containing protein [Bryobacterales bacterium]|nr:YbbR-like domain-containing protein [Bryobacterales bacterium]
MIRVLTENWGYKLFALALSSVFWLLIVDESELATAVMASVEYKNLPRSLEMTSEEMAEKVRLELRGPSSKLRPSDLANTVVVIDLGTVSRPGEHTFSIQQGNTNLAPGISLERAVPARVRLQFEKRQTRTVPVTVQIGTNPPQGYEVESITVNPPSLTVVGSETRVRAVDAIQTDPVDLADVHDNVERKVQTYVSDPQVRLEGNGRVTVRVQVRRKAQSNN